MRRLRSMPYLVLALLLLSVTTASGECAWVLWMESPSGSGQWTLANTVEIGFPDKAMCERRVREARDLQREARETRPGPLAFYACLPDTVDPRGPKR